jgi:hypothetical protein
MMREVACGPKEQPYKLSLGAELLIDLGVRRGSQPLWAPGLGMVRYTVRQYTQTQNIDVHTMRLGAALHCRHTVCLQSHTAGTVFLQTVTLQAHRLPADSQHCLSADSHTADTPSSCRQSQCRHTVFLQTVTL